MSYAEKNERMRVIGLSSKRDIVGAEKQLEDEIKRLKNSNFEFMSTTMVEPLNINEVRRLIPEQVSLISYFVTGGSRSPLSNLIEVTLISLSFASASRLSFVG